MRAQITTAASGSLYFGLPVTSLLNSLVTLTLSAASLTLVQNVAPGKIVSAQASLSPKPMLLCKIKNSVPGIYSLRRHLPRMSMQPSVAARTLILEHC